MAQTENSENGLLDVSWLVPTKTRQLSVVGERGVFLVDTIAQELYFYKNEYVVESAPSNTPVIAGHMTRIKIEKKEPLRVEFENFTAMVSGKANQIVTGAEALVNIKSALGFIESAKSGKFSDMSGQFQCGDFNE